MKCDSCGRELSSAYPVLNDKDKPVKGKFRCISCHEYLVRHATYMMGNRSLKNTQEKRDARPRKIGPAS